MAVVSPKAVGRGISVFVMVEMDNQHSRFQELFERKMRQETDVVSCYEISGDYDLCYLFMLKVWKATIHLPAES